MLDRMNETCLMALIGHTERGLDCLANPAFAIAAKSHIDRCAQVLDGLGEREQRQHLGSSYVAAQGASRNPSPGR